MLTPSSQRPLTTREEFRALAEKLYLGGITYREAINALRYHYLTVALEENRGNACRTADALGMHRNTLARVTDDLQINTREIARRFKKRPRSVGSAATAQTA